MRKALRNPQIEHVDEEALLDAQFANPELHSAEDALWNDALREAAAETALDADWETARGPRKPNHGYDPAVMVVTGYAPGTDPVEITVFAAQPDYSVDVDLQQSGDGGSTEIIIDGRLRAVLRGVTPYEVDPTDLMIEYAG